MFRDFPFFRTHIVQLYYSFTYVSAQVQVECVHC